MAGAKTHEYHILPPSIWPLSGAMSALVMASGAVMWMHEAAYGGWVFLLGLAGVLFTMYSWWADCVREAEAGEHSKVVQIHLRYGMILFIASEVMFFVGWFWSWFDFSLFPSQIDEIGGVWPPQSIEVLDPFKLPLLNTLLLLCSGTTLTWSHHSLLHGDREGAKQGLWLTIILGLVFSAVQAYEYMHASFPFAGLNYSAAFYMATGFHGFHVIVGTIMLIVCLARLYKGHFTPKQHLGFETTAWYWHFVDVVWLFLFVTIYVWGSWGATAH